MKTPTKELESPYLEGELELVVPAQEGSHQLAHAIDESPFANFAGVPGTETGQSTEEMETHSRWPDEEHESTHEDFVSTEADLLDEETGVIDGEDRTQVKNTFQQPYQWICRIALRKNGKEVDFGTGFLISDRHVLTAAHVVEKAFKQPAEYDIGVEIAMNWGTDLGEYSPGKPRLPARYKSDVTPSTLDYALLTLSDSPGSKKLSKLKGKTLGHFARVNLAAADVQGATGHTAGYPTEKDRVARKMFAASGRLTFPGNRALDAAPFLQYSGDTTKGQSGSPVWLNGEDGIQLVGMAIVAARASNTVLRLNAAVWTQLDEWMGEQESEYEHDEEGLHDHDDEFLHEHDDEDQHDDVVEASDPEFELEAAAVTPDTIDEEEPWEVREADALEITQEVGLLDDGVESENGPGTRSDVVKFQWQQKKNGQALSLGLTLGGEDKMLKAPLPGRIRLIEIGGSGKGKGSTEVADERLIATFHGTFHRDPKAPANARIRFEIFGASQAMGPHHPDVLGFDPECVLGVDALVLTFVNREFIVPFPFFVDSLREGQSLEFVAVAEAVNGQTITELGRSSPLSLAIRQKHEVETTTITGGVAQKYTGALVGNQILHHEGYLLDLASHAATATPTRLTARRVPISPKGSPGFSFEKYRHGSLQIILMNDLLDDLVPDNAELKRLIRTPKGVVSKITAKWVRLVLRHEVSQHLNDVFLDAGFTGMSALWDSDKAAAPLVATFTGSFVPKSSGVSRLWERRSTAPLAVPFWTFFVVFDNVDVKSLGLSEGLHIGHRINQGSNVVHLAHPVPIGSGQKQMELPIRIDTTKLTNHVTTELESTQRPSHSVDELQIKRLADRVAAQLANCVAHEVAHSLGLMHDVGLEVAGPYKENTGKSSMSIMSSAAEESALATDAVFSDQAKVIWQLAFGVQPKFQPAPLRNKTWTGDEWKTVDWVERMRRLHRQYGLEQIAFPSYVQTNLPLGKVPPFAGKPPKVQKGTHVP